MCARSQVMKVFSLGKDFGLRFFSAVVLASLFTCSLLLGGAWLRILLWSIGAGLIIELLTLSYYYKPSKRQEHCIRGAIVVLGVGAVFAAFSFFMRIIPEYKGGVLADAKHLERWIFLLGIIVSTDVGAYCVGRLCGGPRLAPRISPQKTWSGFIGGSVWGMVTGLLLCSLCCTHIPYFNCSLRPIQCLALGSLMLSIIAQMGDLIESAAKRFFKVKDSGTIIPGHGGLWDRFDSFVSIGVLHYMMQFFQILS